MEAAPLLEVENLSVDVFGERGVGRAVDGISFTVRRGEALGLIGESGSGKSLTCLTVMRLNPSPSTRVAGGMLRLDGNDLLRLGEDEMRSYRGRRIAMVLQDPMAALNPVFRIGDQIGEALALHRGLRGAGQEKVALELLGRLRVPDPARTLRSFPHQLSGGMRQRVVSAIALAGQPELLIADEPTTALDVTVQAAYLGLLRQLQRESSLAVLFVTHDLGAIARVCDRVAVMYGGRIVEVADVGTVFRAPSHPYTQALLRSMPDVTRRSDRLDPIPGQPPSVFARKQGCPFAPRCGEAMPRCVEEMPPERSAGPGQVVRCWARGAA
ncbi:ABC transporter ATP-binding protein [Sabulicella rubraurantiaca]|uniref:ABC transporter ATP-binding protein n=1 Tax=Sabulicella rubraurantiaca TaxID=2811429 RepID=UPI001A962C57|nr:ABC transporter ATP-binding protein [Sabulicella rubraurantiaca]